MSKQTGPYTSDGTTIRALARAIGSLVQTDGDHNTSIPALTLHRRSGPTEPLHCIYNLGLGVVAQGDKQVLLGEESIVGLAQQAGQKPLAASSEGIRRQRAHDRNIGHAFAS
jgi:hypothetical protein